MPFSPYSEGRVHPPNPIRKAIRKERKRVLQLFIDTQVGSIATGLEAAAVVGKMEGGVFACSDI